MKYALFPGCSATSTGIAYTLSYNYVARACGIELAEIPDWNCCGATSAHRESELLGDALPARSLALSEGTFGDTPVLAPCAGCYQHLKTAVEHARANDERRAKVAEVIQRPWDATADVVNGLEPFTNEDIQAKVRDHVTTPLDGLKVACYYGCALLRPAEVAFDDDEHPQAMEEIVALTGAEPVEWNFHNECCGASHHIAIPEAGRTMTRRILENAAANGADAIACACPLCMLNLDMREAETNAARAKEGLPALDIPVYYFTELLAASFGAAPEKVGLNRHFYPAADLHNRALAAWNKKQEEIAAAKAAAEAEKEAKRKAAAAARAAKKAAAEAAKAEAEVNHE